MKKLLFKIIALFKALKSDLDQELVKVQASDARKAEIRASEFVRLELDEKRVMQSAKNYVHNKKVESVEA